MEISAKLLPHACSIESLMALIAFEKHVVESCVPGILKPLRELALRPIFRLRSIAGGRPTVCKKVFVAPNHGILATFRLNKVLGA